MNTHIFPTILCGGSGTRLWPISRVKHPKQFIKFGNNSLFAQTIDRVFELGYDSKMLILCNKDQRFLTANELTLKGCNLNTNKILLEPIAKNTAPALALAAFAALENDKEAILYILPSDHVISPIYELKKALDKAIPFANKGNIITFGVKPNSPATGYGYIEISEEIEALNIYKIKQFSEKPTQEKAEQLLKDCAVWNSGMFLVKASVYLEELKQYRNDIYSACEKIWGSKTKDLDFIHFEEEIFKSCPAESIDYAIMEHTKKSLVIPLELNWSDLGSWDSFHNLSQHDASNNTLIGDVIAYDTKNSYLHSTSRLVTTLGIDNIAVVETKDSILVCNLDKAQAVKHLFDILKQTNRPEHIIPPIVHRPWGSYESIAFSDRFQVKRITVKPGGILSSQLHHHRSEHWVIVKGTALVSYNENEKLLHEDESIYIPLGVTHRLTNPGCIPLELIEVQTGSYLGEDDIVRFEDVYGRVEKQVSKT